MSNTHDNTDDTKAKVATPHDGTTAPATVAEKPAITPLDAVRKETFFREDTPNPLVVGAGSDEKKTTTSSDGPLIKASFTPGAPAKSGSIEISSVPYTDATKPLAKDKELSADGAALNPSLVKWAIEREAKPGQFTDLKGEAKQLDLSISVQQQIASIDLSKTGVPKTKSEIQAADIQLAVERKMAEANTTDVHDGFDSLHKDKHGIDPEKLAASLGDVVPKRDQVPTAEGKVDQPAATKVDGTPRLDQSPLPNIVASAKDSVVKVDNPLVIAASKSTDLSAGVKPVVSPIIQASFSGEAQAKAEPPAKVEQQDRTIVVPPAVATGQPNPLVQLASNSPDQGAAAAVKPLDTFKAAEKALVSTGGTSGAALGNELPIVKAAFNTDTQIKQAEPIARTVAPVVDNRNLGVVVTDAVVSNPLVVKTAASDASAQGANPLVVKVAASDGSAVANSVVVKTAAIDASAQGANPLVVKAALTSNGGDSTNSPIVKASFSGDAAPPKQTESVTRTIAPVVDNKNSGTPVTDASAGANPAVVKAAGSDISAPVNPLVVKAAVTESPPQGANPLVVKAALTSGGDSTNSPIVKASFSADAPVVKTEPVTRTVAPAVDAKTSLVVTDASAQGANPLIVKAAAAGIGGDGTNSAIVKASFTADAAPPITGSGKVLVTPPLDTAVKLQPAPQLDPAGKGVIIAPADTGAKVTPLPDTTVRTVATAPLDTPGKVLPPPDTAIKVVAPPVDTSGKVITPPIIAAVKVAAAPDAAVKVPAAPDAALKVPAAPDAAVKVPAAPDAAVKVPAAPDSAVKVVAAPDAAVKVVAVPDAAVKVAAAPDSAVKVVAAPDSAVKVVAVPDAAVKVAAAPDAAVKVAAAPDAAVKVPAAPDAAVKVVAAPVETDASAQGANPLVVKAAVVNGGDSTNSPIIKASFSANAPLTQTEPVTRTVAPTVDKNAGALVTDASAQGPNPLVVKAAAATTGGDGTNPSIIKASFTADAAPPITAPGKALVTPPLDTALKVQPAAQLDAAGKVIPVADTAIKVVAPPVDTAGKVITPPVMAPVKVNAAPDAVVKVNAQDTTIKVAPDASAKTVATSSVDSKVANGDPKTLSVPEAKAAPVEVKAAPVEVKTPAIPEVKTPAIPEVKTPAIPEVKVAAGDATFGGLVKPADKPADKPPGSPLINVSYTTDQPAPAAPAAAPKILGDGGKAATTDAAKLNAPLGAPPPAAGADSGIHVTPDVRAPIVLPAPNALPGDTSAVKVTTTDLKGGPSQPPANPLPAPEATVKVSPEVKPAPVLPAANALPVADTAIRLSTANAAPPAETAAAKPAPDKAVVAPVATAVVATVTDTTKPVVDKTIVAPVATAVVAPVADTSKVATDKTVAAPVATAVVATVADTSKVATDKSVVATVTTAVVAPVADTSKVVTDNKSLAAPASVVVAQVTDASGKSSATAAGTVVDASKVVAPATVKTDVQAVSVNAAPVASKDSSVGVTVTQTAKDGVASTAGAAATKTDVAGGSATGVVKADGTVIGGSGVTVGAKVDATGAIVRADGTVVGIKTDGSQIQGRTDAQSLAANAATRALSLSEAAAGPLHKTADPTGVKAIDATGTSRADLTALGGVKVQGSDQALRAGIAGDGKGVAADGQRVALSALDAALAAARKGGVTDGPLAKVSVEAIRELLTAQREGKLVLSQEQQLQLREVVRQQASNLAKPVDLQIVLQGNAPQARAQVVPVKEVTTIKLDKEVVIETKTIILTDRGVLTRGPNQEDLRAQDQSRTNGVTVSGSRTGTSSTSQTGTTASTSGGKDGTTVAQATLSPTGAAANTSFPQLQISNQSQGANQQSSVTTLSQSGAGTKDQGAMSTPSSFAQLTQNQNQLSSQTQLSNQDPSGRGIPQGANAQNQNLANAGQNQLSNNNNPSPSSLMLQGSATKTVNLSVTQIPTIPIGLTTPTANSAYSGLLQTSSSNDPNQSGSGKANYDPSHSQTVVQKTSYDPTHSQAASPQSFSALAPRSNQDPTPNTGAQRSTQDPSATNSTQRTSQDPSQTVTGLTQRSSQDPSQAAAGLTQRSSQDPNQSLGGSTQRTNQDPSQAGGLTQRVSQDPNQSLGGSTQRTNQDPSQAGGLTQRVSQDPNQSLGGSTQRTNQDPSQAGGLTQRVSQDPNQSLGGSTQRTNQDPSQAGGLTQRVSQDPSQSVSGLTHRSSPDPTQTHGALTPRANQDPTQTINNLTQKTSQDPNQIHSGLNQRPNQDPTQANVNVAVSRSNQEPSPVQGNQPQRINQDPISTQGNLAQKQSQDPNQMHGGIAVKSNSDPGQIVVTSPAQTSPSGTAAIQPVVKSPNQLPKSGSSSGESDTTYGGLIHRAGQSEQPEETQDAGDDGPIQKTGYHPEPAPRDNKEPHSGSSSDFSPTSGDDSYGGLIHKGNKTELPAPSGTGDEGPIVRTGYHPGLPGSKETSSKETGSKDNGSKDSGAKDSGSKDSGSTSGSSSTTSTMGDDTYGGLIHKGNKTELPAPSGTGDEGPIVKTGYHPELPGNKETGSKETGSKDNGSKDSGAKDSGSKDSGSTSGSAGTTSTTGDDTYGGLIHRGNKTELPAPSGTVDEGPIVRTGYHPEPPGGKDSGSKDNGSKDSGAKDSGSKDSSSTSGSSGTAGTTSTTGDDTYGGLIHRGNKTELPAPSGTVDEGPIVRTGYHPELPGNKETGSKETGSKETGSKDSGWKDSGAKDSGAKDSGSTSGSTGTAGDDTYGGLIHKGNKTELPAPSGTVDEGPIVRTGYHPELPGNKETGSKETGSKDNASKDSGAKDSGSKDSGSTSGSSSTTGDDTYGGLIHKGNKTELPAPSGTVDEGPIVRTGYHPELPGNKETGSKETGSKDYGSKDSGAKDSGSKDSGSTSGSTGTTGDDTYGGLIHRGNKTELPAPSGTGDEGPIVKTGYHPELPGNKETGSKETGSKETGSKDNGSKDSGWKDSGAKDSGSKDSGSTSGSSGTTGDDTYGGLIHKGNKTELPAPSGTGDEGPIVKTGYHPELPGNKETGSKETGSKETGSKDNGSKDSGWKDSGAKDSGAKDSGSKDSGSTSGSSGTTGDDTYGGLIHKGNKTELPAPSGTGDEGPIVKTGYHPELPGNKETGSKETGSKETGSKDNGSKDSGWKDSGAKDSGAKDSGSSSGSSGTTGDDTYGGLVNKGNKTELPTPVGNGDGSPIINVDYHPGSAGNNDNPFGKPGKAQDGFMSNPGGADPTYGGLLHPADPANNQSGGASGIIKVGYEPGHSTNEPASNVDGHSPQSSSATNPGHSTSSDSNGGHSTQTAGDSNSGHSTQPSSDSIGGHSTQPSSDSIGGHSTQPSSDSIGGHSTQPSSDSIGGHSTQPSSDSIGGHSTQTTGESNGGHPTQSSSDSSSGHSQSNQQQQQQQSNDQSTVNHPGQPPLDAVMAGHNPGMHGGDQNPIGSGTVGASDRPWALNPEHSLDPAQSAVQQNAHREPIANDNHGPLSMVPDAISELIKNMAAAADAVNHHSPFQGNSNPDLPILQHQDNAINPLYGPIADALMHITNGMANTHSHVPGFLDALDAAANGSGHGSVTNRISPFEYVGVPGEHGAAGRRETQESGPFSSEHKGGVSRIETQDSNWGVTAHAQGQHRWQPLEITDSGAYAGSFSTNLASGLGNNYTTGTTIDGRPAMTCEPNQNRNDAQNALAAAWQAVERIQPVVPHLINDWTQYGPEGRITPRHDIDRLTDNMVGPSSSSQHASDEMISARADKSWMNQLQPQTHIDQQQLQQIQQRQIEFQQKLDELQQKLDQQKQLDEERQSKIHSNKHNTNQQQQQQQQSQNQHGQKQQTQGQQQHQNKDDELIRADNYQAKYIVKPNDTLDSIAAKRYGTKAVGELIYELNKAKIPVKIDQGQPMFMLLPGTLLLMPSRRQVRDWRRQRLNQFTNSRRPGLNTMDHDNEQTSDDRRANVEKLLGPVKTTTVPSYTVRLGDTLRSIAMKHPAINDVKLWKLLAQKNGLPLACDEKGMPTHQLRRGTKLLLPTARDIIEFRKVLAAGGVPTAIDISKQITVLELASRECPGCHRLITQSCSVCPACGASIDEQSAITESFDTVISGTARGSGMSAPIPAASLYGETTTPDPADVEQAQQLQTVITTPNEVDPSAPTKSFSSTNTPRVPQESVRPKQEIEVSREENQLAENCRLIVRELERSGDEITRWQLEVLKGERWATILAYELGEAVSVRQETLPSGQTWTMKIELPSQLALDMIKNDLSVNWETYCKKFLAGKRLSA